MNGTVVVVHGVVHGVVVAAAANATITTTTATIGVNAAGVTGLRAPNI